MATLAKIFHFWSGSRNDNFTTSDAGVNDAKAAGYQFIRDDCWVFSSQVSGTIPYNTYWNGSPRTDNFTCAHAQGQKDAASAGYNFIRTNGYVFPDARPGTVPVRTYWSASRQDNYSTAQPQGWKDAEAAGYQFIRIDCYVIADPAAYAAANSSGSSSGGWSVEVLGQWVFIANRDSGGNDVEQITPTNVSAMLSKYDGRADVVAVNSTGWVKRALVPFDQWQAFGTNAGFGIYVKISALIALFERFGVDWGSGWTFFPGMDIPGGDISNFGSCVGNPKASTEATGDTMAFNTNGWLKRVVAPRSTYSKWAYTGYEGSFCRSSHSEAAQSMKIANGIVPLGNWIFVQGVDSGGNDIRNNSKTDNWKGLLDDASSDSTCCAVNTTGWMKRLLTPRASWSRWSANGFQGMFVRTQAWPAVQTTGSDWVGSGWTFFANKDAGGNDLGRIANLDLAALFAAAIADTRCVAFNTNGFLKSAVTAQSTWSVWGGNGDGLYVRNNAIPSS